MRGMRNKNRVDAVGHEALHIGLHGTAVIGEPEGFDSLTHHKRGIANTLHPARCAEAFGQRGVDAALHHGAAKGRAQQDAFRQNARQGPVARHEDILLQHGGRVPWVAHGGHHHRVCLEEREPTGVLHQVTALMRHRGSTTHEHRKEQYESESGAQKSGKNGHWGEKGD